MTTPRVTELPAPPVVSVVIPTYKHRAYVLETLDSVFAQTFTDYEVIVVNDGSPDDTGELLRPLREGGRIRYFEQPNQGQAAARNRGIAEARGEFVALLDDDDCWPADKLSWQVATLRRTPSAPFTAGSCQVVGRGSDAVTLPADEPADDLARRFLTGNWIVSPGQTLIRKSALLAVGGLDRSVWGADDWDLYIRLCRLGPLAYEPRIALVYRFHAGNASRDYWRLYHNSRTVYRKHVAPLRGREGRAARRRSRAGLREFARAFEGLAVERLFAGDCGGARRYYWSALRIDPLIVRRRNFLRGLLRTWIG